MESYDIESHRPQDTYTKGNSVYEINKWFEILNRDKRCYKITKVLFSDNKQTIICRERIEGDFEHIKNLIKRNYKKSYVYNYDK